MYKSPLYIFNKEDLKPAFLSDKNNLLRYRKKLLAELDLSGQATLTLGQQSFSRDDIIKSIDELQTPENLNLHLFVFSQKELLRFLEDRNEAVSPEVLYKVDFIPELATAVNSLLLLAFCNRMQGAIGRGSYKMAAHLLNYLPHFTPEENNAFYGILYKHLADLTRDIKETDTQHQEQIPKRILYLAEMQLADFLNMLPLEMEGKIHALVQAIINLIVHLSNQQDCDREYIYNVSNMLTHVMVNEETTTLIRNNHRYFYRLFYVFPENMPVQQQTVPEEEISEEENTEPEETQTEEKKSSGYDVIIGTIIVLALIVFVSLCTRSN